MTKMRIETRDIHARLKDGREFVFPVFLDPNSSDDKPLIPKKILFEADWVYDLTARQKIKDNCGKFLVPLGVKRVSREWLRQEGFLPTKTMVKKKMPRGYSSKV
jgi:hypothetical protein